MGCLRTDFKNWGKIWFQPVSSLIQSRWKPADTGFRRITLCSFIFQMFIFEVFCFSDVFVLINCSFCVVSEEDVDVDDVLAEDTAVRWFHSSSLSFFFLSQTSQMFWLKCWLLFFFSGLYESWDFWHCQSGQWLRNCCQWAVSPHTTHTRTCGFRTLKSSLIRVKASLWPKLFSGLDLKGKFNI